MKNDRLGVKIPDKPNFKRSSQWPTVRKKWLSEIQTQCQVCDRKTKLEVHHIIPFHIDPSLELDFNNFITLCENSAACCHFIVGHCALSWLKYDPFVIHDAAIIRIMRKGAKP
jgi:HNH endonuclease